MLWVDEVRYSCGRNIGVVTAQKEVVGQICEEGFETLLKLRGAHLKGQTARIILDTGWAT